MAENNTDKEALKAQKDAEKAAKKAKQDRIKQSKPKKDGTAFSRGRKNVSKFFKDFTGTCKKITWPTGKQVVKNTGIVLATILVIGLIVFGIDMGLQEIFKFGENSVVTIAENKKAETESAEATTAAEVTTAAEAEKTSAGDEETEEAEETAEEETEETTVAVSEDVTEAE